jgi:hypothetical protein
LEIFALLVLLILISAGIWLLVLIGSYPGNYARSVGHPQAEAINCMAWVGLLTAGILWFAALIWSRVNYPDSSRVHSTATHSEEQQS